MDLTGSENNIGSNIGVIVSVFPNNGRRTESQFLNSGAEMTHFIFKAMAHDFCQRSLMH